MRNASCLTITVLAGTILLAALSPFLSPQSGNPCAACHGNYYMYLDILEGDAGNQLPAVLNDGELLTVAVMLKVTCNAPNYRTMSSITATLASQNGHFSVATPTTSVGSLANGQTSKATWQISPVSAGSDTLVITASGRNTHNNCQFSDRYSPDPAIVVNKQAVNLAPTISITSPAPGLRLTGGTDRLVGWDATDEDKAGCQVGISYSTDSFAGENRTIATGIPATQTYTWNLPPVDSGNVLVKLTIVDPRGLFGESVMAAPFTIDSTPPSVLSVQPADKEKGTSDSAILVVRFSEPVVELGARAAFGISPDPGGFSWSWNPEQTAMTAVHNSFAAGTTYTCTVAGGVKDLSSPGNPMQGSYQWSFTTPDIIIPVPSISLSDPSGGEKYYWGEKIRVTWRASGGFGNLGVNLSISENDTAGPFLDVAGPLDNSGLHSFNAPGLASDTCLIQAVVFDQNGKESRAISGDFSIARNLMLDATFPTQGTVIMAGNSTNISWSSSGGHGMTSIKLFFQADPASGRVQVASNLPRTGTHRWTATDINTDTARFMLNATDDWNRSLEETSGPFSVHTSTPPPPPPPPPPPAMSNRSPVVVFSIREIRARENEMLTFDASGSFDPDGDRLYYIWDFGDGSGIINTTTSTLSHVFLAGGDYEVLLLVGDWKSEVSQRMTVRVETPPLPSNAEDDWELIWAGMAVMIIGTVGLAYAVAGGLRRMSEPGGAGHPPPQTAPPGGASQPAGAATPGGSDPAETDTPVMAYSCVVSTDPANPSYVCTPAPPADAPAAGETGFSEVSEAAPPARSGVPPLKFDREKCIGCGGCSRKCPEKAITMIEPAPTGPTVDISRFPQAAASRTGASTVQKKPGKRPEVAAPKCNGCGECAKNCVKGAITIHPQINGKGKR